MARTAEVVAFRSAAELRADAMAEVWALLRLSDQRRFSPLTPDEQKRLRAAEAKVNRRLA